MPDRLKAGVENLSGHAMDDVRVHTNSPKPATVQAHAYAQGTDIHIAPGQEQHLPHEAWHVVQQKQGRVKPTLQMKGVAINDDAGLEREADVMGSRAASPVGQTVEQPRKIELRDTTKDIKSPIQRQFVVDNGAWRAKVLQWAIQFAGVDPLLEHARTRNDIRINILFGDDEDNAGETRASWVSQRTDIIVTISVKQDAGDAEVKETLHHELFLHARPAISKHLSALDEGQNPQHSTDDDVVEQEEENEHVDQESWMVRARSAVALHDDDLLDRVITSYSTYNDDLEVFLDRLVAEHVVTQEYAEPFRDADGSDDEEEGSEESS